MAINTASVHERSSSCNWRATQKRKTEQFPVDHGLPYPYQHELQMRLLYRHRWPDYHSDQQRVVSTFWSTLQEHILAAVMTPGRRDVDKLKLHTKDYVLNPN